MILPVEIYLWVRLHLHLSYLMIPKKRESTEESMTERQDLLDSKHTKEIRIHMSCICNFANAMEEAQMEAIRMKMFGKKEIRRCITIRLSFIWWTYNPARIILTQLRETLRSTIKQSKHILIHLRRILAICIS